ncbi:hypothetical protein, partial [Ruminococcus sp.]|uniref:hypothetical protein n=1 Tax=Ruminococcus sp. TaxID=41978 RepID=UPI0025FD457A
DKPETGFGGAVAPVCYERFGFLLNLCDTTQNPPTEGAVGGFGGAVAPVIALQKVYFRQSVMNPHGYAGSNIISCFYSFFSTFTPL